MIDLIEFTIDNTGEDSEVTSCRKKTIELKYILYFKDYIVEMFMWGFQDKYIKIGPSQILEELKKNPDWWDLTASYCIIYENQEAWNYWYPRVF